MDTVVMDSFLRVEMVVTVDFLHDVFLILERLYVLHSRVFVFFPPPDVCVFCFLFFSSSVFIFKDDMKYNNPLQYYVYHSDAVCK